MKGSEAEAWLLPALSEVLDWVFDIFPCYSRCQVRETLDLFGRHTLGGSANLWY